MFALAACFLLLSSPGCTAIADAMMAPDSPIATFGSRHVEPTYYWQISGVVVTPDGQIVDNATVEIVIDKPDGKRRVDHRLLKATPVFSATVVAQDVYLQSPPDGIPSKAMMTSPSIHYLSRSPGQKTVYAHLQLIRRPTTQPVGAAPAPGIATIHAPEGRRIEVDQTKSRPVTTCRLYDRDGGLTEQVVSSSCLWLPLFSFDGFWETIKRGK